MNNTQPQNLELCPECNGNIVFVEEKGESVCFICGLVITEKVFKTNVFDERYYNQAEKNDRRRNGSAVSNLTPDMLLTTKVNKREINNPELERALGIKFMTWKERNLLIALTELKRICSKFNIPYHIKEYAIKLYKKVFKAKLLRGRSINAMVPACIVYACKMHKSVVTINEIIKVSRAKERSIKRAYSIIIKTFKLKIHNTDPVNLIPKYCINLGITPEIETKCIEVLKKFIKTKGISGKDPKGYCAGVIYLVTKLKNCKVPQKIIADEVETTEVTLRSRYKEILNSLNIIAIN